MTVLASTDQVMRPATAPAWGEQSGWLTTTWSAAGGYVIVLAVLVVVSWQTVTHLDSVIAPSPAFPGDSVLGGMARYDGGWYRQVAELGYRNHRPGRQSPVAFFPGYPLTMRYVGRLVGDYAVAGMLVTGASGLGTAVLFHDWCRRRMTGVAAATAVALLLLYPYGYYLYGLVYADALFLLATLVAFHLIDQDRPFAAGLAGAVATATRPVGLAVTLGLAVRALERSGALTRCSRRLGIPTRINLRRARLRDTPVLLSVIGLAAYAGFLWARFGNPFLFSEVQRQWGQAPGPHTWLKVQLLDYLRLHPDSPYVWGLLLQGALAVAALTAVPAIGRRFGWGYATYVAAALVIALVGTKDFQGLGRYLLAAFPVFALLGERVAQRPRPVPQLAVAGSGLALALGAAGFAHGLYLS